MPEREKRAFGYRELAELLVKHADIHEGHWGLWVEFGLGAANIPVGGSAGDLVLKPAAVVPVNKIGIQGFGEPTPLTVDAAQVNPRGHQPRKPRRARKKDQVKR